MPTAASSRVTDRGSSRTPVSSALSPSATERNSGIVKNRPAWIRNWKKNMTSPPSRRALRNSVRSTSGSRPWATTRCSHHPKMRRTTSPATIRHRVMETPNRSGAFGLARTQPHSPERSTPYTARPNPRADRTTPGMSRLNGEVESMSWIFLVSSRIAATMTTSPAKTRRQVQNVVTAPPMSGPAATAIAPAEATRP